jgi:RNA polymerase sigma-70 factor (ECF subfamily)
LNDKGRLFGQHGVARPRSREISSRLDWRSCLLCLSGLLAAHLLVQFPWGALNELGEPSVLQEREGADPHPEGVWNGSRIVFLSDVGTGAVSSSFTGGFSEKTSPIPDAVLVGRVRKGEAAAFEDLVRRYIRTAHSLAMSVVGSPDLADDVCQEAFLAALSRIEQCRHPDRFRAWLMTIVRNRALNLRGSEFRRAHSSLEAVGQFASPQDPQQDLKRKALREEIDSAVDDLPGLKRKVFVLHDIQGWDHAGISKELEISRGSSRVHLHGARQILRTRLAKNWMEEA